jgi:hypothetical protein
MAAEHQMGCGCVQSSNAARILENYAGAKKSNTRNNIGDDLSFASRSVTYKKGTHHKRGCSGRNERVCAGTSHSLTPLPLESNNGSEQ